MDEKSSNWVYSEYTINMFDQQNYAFRRCWHYMQYYFPKLSYPKNRRKTNWNPKKILRSSSPLEVQSTPTPPRSTLSLSKFLTNWAAPALFLPTRTAKIHSFICLSCSWFVGNSIRCSIKLRFHLNMVCWSVLTVASLNQGQIVQSWVKITQDKCKIWIKIWKSKKANSL